ncbi:MAG TPA: insulinase family protein [Sphingomonas sp.]|nr:insulinase family protein [Sphingomonas sp.]
MLRPSRLSRVAFATLPFLLIAGALPAQQVPQPAPTTQGPAVAVDKSAWLYKGSDITPDPDWRFGTLPNGLRYAVRKNGVPPGQVAIRVRMDVGSLHEKDSERGFAHLIEHLSFRGSEHVPDGEAKRIWQRMGVTFGADTNASTSFTQTVYKLDLPMANAGSLNESLKILSGMMAGPSLTQTALNAERPVVLSEAREQPGPQVRLGDATREVFFAGQPLAERSPIGTTDTLGAATAESVKAFHDRWYRPERAIVVISGDMDPALFEAAIVKHFADWRGNGPAVPAPDFGTPKPAKSDTAALVEPQLPTLVSLAWLRPWTVGDDTVIFNQKRMIDMVAVRIVNRRLESRARGGGSFISAGANLEDISRSANATLMNILPLGNDWQTALKDVRTGIADAIATPPTQGEIDRELTEIETAMKASVDQARVEAGAKKADDLVEAVDIKETTTTPQTSLGILQDAMAKKMFTPAAVQASAKAVFSGVALRGVVNTPQASENAAAALQAALTAEVKPGLAASGKLRAIGFDALPKLGPAGKVVARTVAVADPKIEKITFANGVNLLLFENPSEASRVYVRVRFGHGIAGLPSDRQTPAYAGELALVASGIGKLGQEEIDRITSGRRIALDFAVDDDAFVFGSTTSAGDLADQLKLIAAKLALPGWDPNPVARAKAVMLAGYASQAASPDGVLGRDLDRLLHDGDPRWGTPTRTDLEKLDAKSFRAFWEPILASGPIEVQIYGDMKSDAAIAAVASSLGALKPRKASPATTAPVRFPAPTARPVERTHDGRDTQAAAVIAWPTGGGSDGIATGRKLEVLAAIFRDRLLDKLRSSAGISYTPNVASNWPVGLNGGGRIMAIGSVPPDKTGYFFDLSREIAADLVARPVDADELRRALVPVVQYLARLSTGNQFWLMQTEGGSFDPKRLKALDTIATDLTTITPQEVQALAARYLVPAKAWTMTVLPKDAGKPAAK